MLRRIVTVPSIAFAFTLAGCELIYDFEKPATSAAGSDGGGHANKGGNVGNVAGAGNKTGTSINASTTGGASSSVGGNSSTAISSGGTSGGGTSTTVTTSVGATTSVDTTNTSTTGGTSSIVGSGAGGATSGVTSGLGGGTTAGTSTTSIGGAGTGGVATVIGSAGKTGVSTGGAAPQGGAAGSGGSATGGVVARGGTTATGGVATGGVATGGVATGGVATGGAATGGTTSDTTPPTVVSVAPLNGSKGVTSDVTITLNFSEPMDKASVKSALSVSSFVASDLNLQWNASGTSLNILPNGGFIYATGQNSLGTTAKNYTVTIGTAARDVSGNAMVASYSSSFTTLKRCAWQMSPAQIINSDTYMRPHNTCTDTMNIGWWNGKISSGDYIGYLVFDLTNIDPASDMYSLESATLAAQQLASKDNFYQLGNVHVRKLQYWPDLGYIEGYAVLAEVGTLASSDTAAVRLETLQSFKDDFVTNGTMMHLYRLSPSFLGGTAGAEQYASFACGGFTLTVTYLIP